MAGRKRKHKMQEEEDIVVKIELDDDTDDDECQKVTYNNIEEPIPVVPSTSKAPKRPLMTDNSTMPESDSIVELKVGNKILKLNMNISQWIESHKEDFLGDDASISKSQQLNPMCLQASLNNTIKPNPSCIEPLANKISTESQQHPKPIQGEANHLSIRYQQPDTAFTQAFTSFKSHQYRPVFKQPKGTMTELSGPAFEKLSLEDQNLKAFFDSMLRTTQRLPEFYQSRVQNALVRALRRHGVDLRD